MSIHHNAQMYISEQVQYTLSSYKPRLHYHSQLVLKSFLGGKVQQHGVLLLRLLHATLALSPTP